MVLIVTDPDDGHLPPVQLALDRLGVPHRRLDLAALPARATISIAHRGGAGRTVIQPEGEDPIDLGAVTAVWWRRPRPYAPDPSLGEGAAAFAFDQVHEAVAGAWGALRARWLNDPWADQRAAHKPVQLAAATALGLRLPDTLVTSCPTEAQRFLARLRGRPVIRKPLRPAAHVEWQPTALVTPADLDRLDLLRLAPTILQAYVPGVDVRVTVVGDEVLAAEIDARETSSPTDFRPALAGCRVAPLRLPPPLEEGCRALVRALGLGYAALDFRRDAEGDHHFLEANPAGQWLFVEERTGLPIAAAIAAWLARRTA